DTIFSYKLPQQANSTSYRFGGNANNEYALLLFAPKHVFTIIKHKTSTTCDFITYHLVKLYPDVKGTYYDVLLVKFTIPLSYTYNASENGFPNDGSFNSVNGEPKVDIIKLDYFSLMSSSEVYDVNFNSNYEMVISDLVILPLDWDSDLNFINNLPTSGSSHYMTKIYLPFSGGSFNLMTFSNARIGIIDDNSGVSISRVYDDYSIISSYRQNIFLKIRNLAYKQERILSDIATFTPGSYYFIYYPPATEQFFEKVIKVGNSLPYGKQLLSQKSINGTFYIDTQNASWIPSTLQEFGEPKPTKIYECFDLLTYVRNERELVFCYYDTAIPMDFIVFDTPILDVVDTRQGYIYVFTEDGIYIVRQINSGFIKDKISNIVLYKNPSHLYHAVNYSNAGVLFIDKEFNIYVLNQIVVNQILYPITEKLKAVRGDNKAINIVWNENDGTNTISCARMSLLYSHNPTNNFDSVFKFLTEDAVSFVVDVRNNIIYNKTFALVPQHPNYSQNVDGVFVVGSGSKQFALIRTLHPSVNSSFVTVPFLVYNVADAVLEYKTMVYAQLHTISIPPVDTSQSVKFGLDFQNPSYTLYQSNPPVIFSHPSIAPNTQDIENEVNYILKAPAVFRTMKVLVRDFPNSVERILGFDIAYNPRSIWGGY
ncbi:MAG: hypothetical protein ABDH28_01940, partial [Brevinematia bacterium]